MLQVINMKLICTCPKCNMEVPKDEEYEDLRGCHN